MRLLLAAVLLTLAAGTPVRAHQIESALEYLDGDLELSTRFSNGEPAAGAVVRLLQADGTPGEELGRTDASGQIRLDLNGVKDGRYDLQVDGGPGHRDYLEVPVQAGRVKLDEVVQSPIVLVVVGLLVNVQRRRNHPGMTPGTGSEALDRMVERLGGTADPKRATSTSSGSPRNSIRCPRISRPTTSRCGAAFPRCSFGVI